MKTNISNLLKNLFDLTQRFYNGEELSAKEIAQIYNVNLRTAQRYPKYLKEAGLDIRKDKTKYFLKMPVGVENIIDIAKKLNFSIPIIDKLKTSIYYSKLDIEKVDLEKFEILENAIKNKNKLEIIYEEFKGYDSKLTDVKPLKIVNFEGYWYLLVLNYQNKYRRYYINNMKKIKVLKETFDIDKEFLNKVNKKAINVWYDPFKEPYLVELYLDKTATKFFKRLSPFKLLNCRDYEDKTSIITLQITHDYEIISFILRWIPHIKVISPNRLKEKILDEVKEYSNDL